MILIIDNYDSFTYNLVQGFGSLGAEVSVVRNDAISPEEIERYRPDRLVVSPGPRTPRDAGISIPAIQHLAGRIPILGVCLGHQCIACAFGGGILPARRLMHGKTSTVRHDDAGLFRGLPNPLIAMRYHSLAVDEATLPGSLSVTARAEDGEAMGLRHRDLPIEGVQFHPESYRTEAGMELMRNFLKL